MKTKIIKRFLKTGLSFSDLKSLPSNQYHQMITIISKDTGASYQGVLKLLALFET